MNTSAPLQSAVAKTDTTRSDTFYCGPNQEEVLARLHYCVERSQPLGLLVGPDGSGKSRLLNVLGQQLRTSGHRVVLLNLLASDQRALLMGLATGLQCRVRPNDTIDRLWQVVSDYCAANRYLRQPTVFLFDDVDQTPDSVTRAIVRLLRGCRADEAHTTTIVSAHADRVSQLDARLLDLASLRIELEAWDVADVERYVANVISQTTETAATFTPDAITRLQTIAAGQARRICQLVALAFAAAAASATPVVDATTIDAVAEELATP